MIFLSSGLDGGATATYEVLEIDHSFSVLHCLYGQLDSCFDGLKSSTYLVVVFIYEVTENPAEFQTAIAATKFGKFNILLILGCIPAALTIQFESTLNSFIIPAAACDLELTSTEKGLLNSMPFFGK